MFCVWVVVVFFLFVVFFFLFLFFFFFFFFQPEEGIRVAKESLGLGVLYKGKVFLKFLEFWKDLVFSVFLKPSFK